MAAEELLKDFILLQRAVRQVRVWADTDVRAADAGLKYHQEQVNQLADEAYTRKWLRGIRESERAIASLQGLGHKRATLLHIREETEAIVSYHNACRTLGNIIYLRVLVGRLVEDQLDCDAAQINLKIFSYFDNIDLFLVRDLFDDIHRGWLTFIESYNKRPYTGYGRAMPSYIHEPQIAQPASSTCELPDRTDRRESRGPGHVRFGAADEQ